MPNQEFLELSSREYLTIQIDDNRDALLTQQGKDLVEEFYCRDGESIQEAFARAAVAFCGGDFALAQRIYDHVSQLHFMFSSPILSNAPLPWEEPKGMPISCFLSYVPDSINGQVSAYTEAAALSVAGGGIGMHNGIRAVSDKAPGPIPYMKTLDAAMGYYRQGGTRRGSLAYYMDIDHPSIIEHIQFRIPTGGDSARKADNRKSFHTAVNLTHEFTEAVQSGGNWHLKCPHTGNIVEVVDARYLWEMILEARALTGEPYINFIDVARDDMPDELREVHNLQIHGSNLCNEIHLPTDENRSAVCCLSSVNLEKWEAWKDTGMVKDLVTYLDNVLSYFISEAPPALAKAVHSAEKERSIGIGAMGFHGLLMQKGIAWESGGFNSAAQLNNKIFNKIQKDAYEQSAELAKTKGAAPDMLRTGLRNAHLMAIAPNANSSIICNCTASIEPINSNAYPHTTRAGTYLVKNKHLDKVLLEYISCFDVDWYEEQWQSIIAHDGSVQHLEWMPQAEKDIFKTAWEIDQMWVVQHAEDRQKYICQGQSVNLFFPSGTDKAYINAVHMKALKGRKLKGLYYFRTTSKQDVDTVRSIQRKALVDFQEGEECLSCQG